MKALSLRVFAWVFFTLLYGFSAVFAAKNVLPEPSKDKPVAYLFAHGLGATQQQYSLFASVGRIFPDGSYRVNNPWFLFDPLVLFNFPDAKNDKGEYFKEHVNLGQKKDIEQLQAAIEKAKLRHPGFNLVLTGISRGASTIFNYLALAQPLNISAAVLESPFDSFKSIINHLLKRFGVQWVPFSEKIGARIAQSQFPSLNLDGVAPFKVAPYIPYHIPILFVHSVKDRVIPIQCSRKLYIMLKETGHQHVYLLELPGGDHGKLMNSEHATMYQNIVHAFYKKYGLPHHEAFAAQGEPILSMAQPTIPEVQTREKRSIEGELNE